MIQSKSPAVLYVNKISVLLVSLLLLLLWFQLNSHKTKSVAHTNSTQLNQKPQSKYLKTIPSNPFLRTEIEQVKDDSLPTVTSLLSAVPTFASLQLRLHGIVYQQNQNSYVMVSMQGAIQEIYQLNQQISEGLFITEISRKQLEVDYFGERHNLFIENKTVQLEDVITQTSIKNKVSINFDQQLESLEVDKKRNPIRLFMIRRPYAVYSQGEFQGYKIMPGSNEDQFKRLGFKSGDIITYLNGIEFTGPGMKEYVIEQLTHAMHIDLTVLREGQELNINYGF